MGHDDTDPGDPMSDSAFFAQHIWTPGCCRIRIAGVDYYCTVGDVEQTPADMATEINAAIAGSGVACAWSYTLGNGSFTFAGAGIFAMIFYGRMAAVLGFSTDIWGGAASYTSDVRPLGWWRNEYPIQNYRPSWHWSRGVQTHGLSYRAIPLNAVAARMSLDLMIDIDDLDDFRHWTEYAALHRAMTFWFSVSAPAVAWSITAWYGRRDECLYISTSIQEIRDSGRVERLYSATLDVEVIDGA